MSTYHKEISDNTMKLLRQLSNHLSSRESCKRASYVLCIDDRYKSGYDFNLDVYVFPDKHHRKSSYKSKVLRHILKYHMPEVCKESDEGDYVLDTSKVMPGTYVYTCPLNMKRRRWVRLES